MNFKKIAVYDFETDSPNPQTCNPTELACLMLNPRTLEVIDNSEFCAVIKPPDIDNVDYINQHKSTIEFHAKANKCSEEDILNKWKAAQPQEIVWNNFKEYLLKYHTTNDRKSMFTAPIMAGMNIYRFDNIIIDRLATLYGDINKDGGCKLFYPRDKIDLLNILFQWFENLDDLPSYSMDVIRPFFGLSTEGSHNALKDVQDTASLIARFLKLTRRYAPKITFKGALNENI